MRVKELSATTDPHYGVKVGATSNGMPWIPPTTEITNISHTAVIQG